MIDVQEARRAKMQKIGYACPAAIVGWRRSRRFENRIIHPYNLVGMDRARPVMATWQVQEAKTRLRELIERANTEGPQTITRHGAERAVVLSIEDYRRWQRTSRTSRHICSAAPRSMIFRLSVSATAAEPSSFDRGGRLSPGYQCHVFSLGG